MSGFNLAAKSKEEQDKVAIDLVASGVAYKKRLAMPVVAELGAREQPEHLREYFWARLEHYRQLSKQLPDKNAPVYAKKRMKLKNSVIPDAFCLSPAGFFLCRVMVFSGQCVFFFPAGDNT
ncbi:DNA polymerase III subunit theta, partial [Salmonella enterica]|nr:DNA polymerase III subunit theta [Salmonella enterica]